MTAAGPFTTLTSVFSFEPDTIPDHGGPPSVTIDGRRTQRPI